MNREQKIFQKVIKARYNRLSRIRREAMKNLKQLGRIKRSPEAIVNRLSTKKTFWGWCVYYWKKIIGRFSR